MKKPFQWNWNQYVYSFERLIKLIDDDKSRAVFHLTQKNFENWFDSIGEIELYEKAEECRKNFNPSNSPDEQFKPLIQELEERKEERKNKSNHKKFLKLLDIDKAIEITLKEYEALRAEVLQNSSEISQLILLGLAAIFTIASIGLAPLSDFLTVEDTTIEMPLTLKAIDELINIKNGAISIKNKDFNIYNKPNNKQSGEMETSSIKVRDFFQRIDENIDDPTIQQILDKIIQDNPDLTPFNINTATVIVRDTSNDIQYYLKIERAINNKTIEDKGIVPSIVIFNWLIPGLSLYLIYRSLFAIKKNRMIGTYIYHRIEQKLVNLSFLKKQYLEIENNDINFIDQDPYFTTDKNNFKEHLTHISWQHYITDQKENYSDPLDANLIYIFFSLISSVSFVGGSALLVFNFELDQWPWDDFWKDILTDHPNIWWSIVFFFLVIVVLGCCYYFFLQPKNIKLWHLRSFIVILTILYVAVFAGLLAAFYGIPSQKLDHTQLLFLLVLPLLIYTVFIMFCLKIKDEVEKLIDPGSKNDFRTNSTDSIVKEMWDTTP
ncbi:MAG: hypothetical protein AB4062_02935 [Crocosphaera sp.]